MPTNNFIQTSTFPDDTALMKVGTREAELIQMKQKEKIKKGQNKLLGSY